MGVGSRGRAAIHHWRGMQTGVATMEISVEVSQKSRNKTAV